MKYKCVIWDWNGTLLNDVQVSVATASNMLKARGFKPVTLESYRDAFEFPIRNCYMSMGFNFDDETFHAVSKEYLYQYQIASAECNLSDGAEEVLQYFHSHNIEQIIISASEKQNLFSQLKHFPIEQYFSHVMALDDHYAISKVELGKKFFSESSYKKEDILFIGDTIHDYETASGIGCDCVLICNGHQGKERLLTVGVPVLDNITQLINFTK